MNKVVTRKVVLSPLGKMLFREKTLRTLFRSTPKYVLRRVDRLGGSARILFSLSPLRGRGKSLVTSFSPSDTDFQNDYHTIRITGRGINKTDAVGSITKRTFRRMFPSLDSTSDVRVYLRVLRNN